MLSIATPAIVGWGKLIPSKPRSRASAGYKSVVNADRLTGASGSAIFFLLNGHMANPLLQTIKYTPYTQNI